MRMGRCMGVSSQWPGHRIADPSHENQLQPLGLWELNIRETGCFPRPASDAGVDGGCRQSWESALEACCQRFVGQRSTMTVN